jgi:hypothetical protein
MQISGDISWFKNEIYECRIYIDETCRIIANQGSVNVINLNTEHRTLIYDLRRQAYFNTLSAARTRNR